MTLDELLEKKKEYEYIIEKLNEQLRFGPDRTGVNALNSKKIMLQNVNEAIAKLKANPSAISIDEPEAPVVPIAPVVAPVVPEPVKPTVIPPPAAPPTGDVVETVTAAATVADQINK